MSIGDTASFRPLEQSRRHFENSARTEAIESGIQKNRKKFVKKGEYLDLGREFAMATRPSQRFGVAVDTIASTQARDETRELPGIRG